MLVLTRKQNEKICIGENITITVIRMKGKSVRLGIEAPKSVNVLRGGGELLLDSDSADIHCESSAPDNAASDQAAEETVIECRIPRAEHEAFVV